MKKGISFFIACLLIFSISSYAQVKNDSIQWWKESVFYEIYMPSYADSDGDGYGDFKGMTGKLDYLEGLGVKGVWLTPFLRSPKVDNGYDVASYYDIDAAYGTTEDFKNYITAAHERGIKVIMDMVLNHTSTESEWFRESRKSVSNPYRNYYIWKDKPNNWESFFGGGAWKKDSLTHQYYYHKFDIKMADLNWANPEVVKAVQKVLRYWLNLGVDGFRLDVINFLTTDGITADNVYKDGKQEHINDINQPGVKEAIRKIRAVVNEFPGRFIVGEIGSDKMEWLKQYQAPDLLDVVFNFNFGSIPKFSLQQIFRELQSMEKNMPGFPTLFFGSHDMPRMMDRLAGGDPARAIALTALILTAKGVPFIYYGEEIGMRNIIADNISEVKDIQGKTHYQLAIKAGKSPEEALVVANEYNRDKSRSPMQWNGNVFAGFSAQKSWIKINQGYREVNVETLSANQLSILSTCKALIALRNKEKVLQYGKYDQLELKGDRLLFSRSFEKERISVIINFGHETRMEIPSKARILMGDTLLKTNGFLIYKTG